MARGTVWSRSLSASPIHFQPAVYVYIRLIYTVIYVSDCLLNTVSGLV